MPVVDLVGLGGERADEETSPAAAPGLDSGLASLLIVARYFGVPADGDRLRRELATPGRPLGEGELVRAARSLGLKARAITGRASRLSRYPLPALAAYRDGTFVIVARAEARVLHVHSPLEPRPLVLAREAFEARWARRLILVARRSSGGREVRPFGFRWFLPAVFKYRALLIEVLAASFFLQVFALLGPLFTQVIVDKVLVHRSLTTLHVIAAGMLFAAVFETVLGALRTYVLAHTGSRIDVELGARLYRHVLALPLAYFEARRVGDTVARVRELETIRRFLTGSSVTLIIDVLFTVVFVAVLALYSPVLTAIVLAALPAWALLAAVVTPVLRARLDAAFDSGAEAHAFLVESITGIQTVKSIALEPEMRRRWEERLARHARTSFRAATLASGAGQAASLLHKGVGLAILWVGAQAVMREELTVGELIAFNMLAGRVTGPAMRLAQVWQEFQQAALSVRRLADLLDAPAEPAPPATRTAPAAIAGRVELEEVTFRYRLDRPEVLRAMSLTVSPGEIVAIVGRSGSGKSTIARLMQRLYVPERGRVLVDGLDVGHADPAWLRRQIGVVPQESFLFNLTVRENIALADPGVPAERVIRAAQLAGAHEFVMGLPDGYDTVVGEHGCALSGGQRQRIAIARALVGDPRILVLDEATSALDYESERIVHQNLAQICAGRTVVIIAHRLSAVRRAHRILLVESGSIVEEGSHTELLERDGRYAQLFRQQFGPARGAGTALRPAAGRPTADAADAP
jgi:ATP-binding cassette, subfamily B, bacterial HlyB/CyaB